MRHEILKMLLSVSLAVATNTGPSNQASETVLKEKSPSSSQPIRQLTEQLGASRYEVREKTSAQLVQIGLPAKEALYLAYEHPDLEIRVRARRALHDMWQRYATKATKDFLAGSSIDEQTLPNLGGHFNDQNQDVHLLEVSGFVSGMSEVISLRIEAFAADHQKVLAGFPQRDRLLLQRVISDGVIRQKIYADIEPAVIRAIRSLGGSTAKHNVGINTVYAYSIKGSNCDQIIALLWALPRLKTVRMTDSFISDLGLEQLSQLTGLEELHAESDRITDAGVSHISKLSSLKKLTLTSSQVTDQGLAYLSNLQELRYLYLRTPESTDDGMLYLRKIPKLQFLTLHGSQLTDDGLFHLCQSNSLINITLFNTRVTSAGVDAAKAVRPKINIYSSQSLPSDPHHHHLLDRE